MLVEQIIKQTVDLQGFRVHTVTKDPGGLVAEIRPDTRHRIRCGTCGRPAVYRDMRDVRFFRHVPLWNIPVWFRYQHHSRSDADLGAGGDDDQHGGRQDSHLQ